MGSNLAPQATQGPIDKCPCPWCGKPNNFTEVDHLISDTDVSQGKDDPGGGAVFACDFCSKNMRVVAVKVFKVISVRQVQ